MFRRNLWVGILWIATACSPPADSPDGGNASLDGDLPDAGTSDASHSVDAASVRDSARDQGQESADMGTDQGDMSGPVEPFELSYEVTRLGDFVPSRISAVGERFVVMGTGPTGGAIAVFEPATGTVDRFAHATGEASVIWVGDDGSFALLAEESAMGGFEVLRWSPGASSMTTIRGGMASPVGNRDLLGRRHPGGYFYLTDATTRDPVRLDLVDGTAEVLMPDIERVERMRWDPRTGRVLVQVPSGFGFQVTAFDPPSTQGFDLGMVGQNRFHFIAGSDRAIYTGLSGEAGQRIWDFEAMESRLLFADTEGYQFLDDGRRYSLHISDIPRSEFFDIAVYDLSNETLLYEHPEADHQTVAFTEEWTSVVLGVNGADGQELVVHDYATDQTVVVGPSALWEPPLLASGAPGVAANTSTGLRIWKPNYQRHIEYGTRPLGVSSNADLWLYSVSEPFPAEPQFALLYTPDDEQQLFDFEVFNGVSGCNVAIAPEGERAVFRTFTDGGGTQGLHMWSVDGGLTEIVSAGVQGAVFGGTDCEFRYVSDDLQRGLAVSWQDGLYHLDGWVDDDVFTAEPGADNVLWYRQSEDFEQPLFGVTTGDQTALKTVDFAARESVVVDPNIAPRDYRRDDDFFVWAGYEPTCASDCARTLRVTHPLATNAPFDVHQNFARLYIVFRGYILFEQLDGALSIASPQF